ncbi:serine/threonine-protein kinase [Actinomadura hibisca]|uniref:serine/threonine-protein kinase n=1 Tax=Actinomadura hibisca TaxID=68565 RepID=UPI001FE1C726|nr:serine/threonine-protein kinase [Actinomadura hibisca]
MPNETTGERLLAQRYRLVTKVGRGGMGTVWQAHDEVLGRDVAVKEVILPHGLTDEERAVQYKRTFREARTAARLGHPGVVTVYDVVEEDGRPWIIMELIHARSLDQVIKQDGPLEVRRAAEIGRQMLAALHAAHDAGVLHRDVKPSNVLLTAGDRAVLTDFGIATAAGDATLTQTGLVMGSPAYIAPERARGRTAGPASDLWSLGVTLYAMVHGRSPFERSEPMAALVAVISEEPDPPDKAGRLAPVIEGLLRKNPDERMDVIEAGALLDGIVRQETVDTQRTMTVEVTEDMLAPPEPAAPPAPRAEPPAERPTDGRTRVTPAAGEEPAGASAATWHAGPHTEPASRPPAERGPSGGLNRNAVLVGAIILVALLAVGGIALALTGDDKPADKQSNQKPIPASSAPSSKPPNSPSPSATPTSEKPKPSDTPKPDGVPAGFRSYKDKTGFSLAVPEDYKGPRHGGSSVYFDAPGGGYIQIDQTSSPGPSALNDWKNSHAGAGKRFSNYRMLRLEPTGNHPPVPDSGDGDKSADWEFTHGKNSRILNRGFVANGHGYAILISGSQDGWDERMAKLAPVFSSFEPAGD